MKTRVTGEGKRNETVENRYLTQSHFDPRLRKFGVKQTLYDGKKHKTNKRLEWRNDITRQANRVGMPVADGRKSLRAEKENVQKGETRARHIGFKQTIYAAKNEVKQGKKKIHGDERRESIT